MKKEYKLACGCVLKPSGYVYCEKHTNELREKIWLKLAEKKKKYDRRKVSWK